MSPESPDRGDTAVVEILNPGPVEIPCDERDPAGSTAAAPSPEVPSLDSGVGDGDRPRPAVSIVCPFYNEEAIIEAAMRRMVGNLRSDLGDDGWELILVNDGSSDGSLERLISGLEQAAYPHVRVMTCDVNQGRGRALSIGVAAARGDVIVTTEVDCSWGDDIVARLVEVLDTKPEVDFVVASPHLPGGGLANVPSSRVFLTRVGNQLIRRFFASHVTMNTGMTRSYRRHVIQPLIAHENGKEFHLEVLLKLLTLGFRVHEIPATITWQDHKLVDRPTRVDQPTHKRKSSTRIVSTINTHLRFIAIAQPVKYFAWLSAISMVIGAGFVGAAGWMLLASGPAVYLAIIGLIMLMFCLLFLGFSVLFFQMRESMRETWMRSYPGPHPPSARPGVVVSFQKHARGNVRGKS